MDKRYIYGRVRIFDAAKFFLSRPGSSRSKDFELVVCTYASSAEESESMIRAARALAHELNCVADDLERYVEVYDFANDDTEAADKAARAAVYGEK